jgi:hypothetical protein
MWDNMKLDTLKWAVPTAISLILLTLTIYDRLTAPNVNLKADVQFDTFIWPADFPENFRRYREAFSIDSLKRNVDLDGLSKDNLRSEQQDRIISDYVLELVELYARQRLPWSIPEPYASIRGYWLISVENGKDLAVDSVDIKLPDAFLVQVKREGREAYQADVDEIVNLGQMRPGEATTLIAWTRYPPSLYKAGYVRLTHKGGLGDVKIIEGTEAENHSWNLITILSTTPLAALIIYFIATLIYQLGYKSALRSHSESDNPKPEADSEEEAGDGERT